MYSKIDVLLQKKVAYIHYGHLDRMKISIIIAQVASMFYMLDRHDQN